MKKGRHRFSANRREFKVKINPIIIPQSTATALYYISEDISLTQAKLAILNLGYSHTGYTVLNKCVIDKVSAGSCDVSIRTLFNKVENIMQRDFEQSLSYHDIRSVIAHKTINTKGQQFSLEHNRNTTIRGMVL